MQQLSANLFDLEKPSSIGTKLYLRFFELFTAVWSIAYAWSWGTYILRISDVVLPLGIANYVNIELFFGNNLPLVNAALITLCCLIAFSFKKGKWLYGVAILLLHLQYAVRFSQGEIPHSPNLIGFSLLGLGIGSVFIKDKQQSLHFAFGLTLFFIGLGYTTAGFSKLIATGFDWVDGRHLWLWIAEKTTDLLSATGEYKMNIVQELALEYRWMATAFLTIGLITELSGVLLWWKKFRVYVFIGLIGLHLGIYLTMNIVFVSYTIMMFIIGFPWHKLLNKMFTNDLSQPENKIWTFILGY